MKDLATRALCALSLAGFASTASAVPFYFEFSGTITSTTGTYANNGLEGAGISGGFSFDTAQLTPLFSPDLALAQFYPSPTGNSHAFLNHGPGSDSTPFYSQDNGASIFFADTDCYHLAVCNPLYQYQEGFSLSAATYDGDYDLLLTPGSVGQVRESALNVSSWNYDYADFASFDWASASPLDIVSRVLHNTSGFYADSIYSCTGEPSCNHEEAGAFYFSIDSVARGSGARAVPEPPALALLVLGLAGLCWVRRRGAGDVNVRRLWNQRSL